MLAVWFWVWLIGFGATPLIHGMFPTNLVVITWIWSVFEVPIAAVAGAWLYREESAESEAAGPQG